MSDVDSDEDFRLLFERTFIRLVETEKRLGKMTMELENMQATLSSMSTRVGDLLGPIEIPQGIDHHETRASNFSEGQRESTTRNNNRAPTEAIAGPEVARRTPQLEIGLATEMVIHKHGLRAKSADLEDEIVCFLKYINHMDWYWRLIDDSGLDEDTACELTIAMHLDNSIAFDYGICTLTPYSPWTMH